MIMMCDFKSLNFFQIFLAKAKVPHFMLENAFDTSVARRVKRAYTSLDAFGLRTGMYLRRYPLLRTILFLYVVSIKFHVQCYILFWNLSFVPFFFIQTNVSKSMEIN